MYVNLVEYVTHQVVLIDSEYFDKEAELEAYTKAHQLKSVTAVKIIETYAKYLDV